MGDDNKTVGVGEILFVPIFVAEAIGGVSAKKKAQWRFPAAGQDDHQ